MSALRGGADERCELPVVGRIGPLILPEDFFWPEPLADLTALPTTTESPTTEAGQGRRCERGPIRRVISLGGIMLSLLFKPPNDVNELPMIPLEIFHPRPLGIPSFGKRLRFLRLFSWRLKLFQAPVLESGL